MLPCPNGLCISAGPRESLAGHAETRGEHVLRALLKERGVTTEALPQGFHRVRAHYGFMEWPNAQEILGICGDLGIRAQAEETTYYVDSSRLLPTGPAPMMRWRKRL